MNTKRPRRIYLPIIGLIFCLGLPARTTNDYLPSWYVNYFGDFLWAMMLFFLCAVLFRWQTKWAVLATIASTWLIEVSQLYHAPWIDSLRDIKVLGLILGYGFLWSDLVAYTAGISLGAAVDYAILRKQKGRDNNAIGD